MSRVGDLPTTTFVRKLALVLVIAIAAALSPATAALARPLAHASIVGGLPAPAGSWPWAAFIADLQGDAGMACTGTVVASSTSDPALATVTPDDGYNLVKETNGLPGFGASASYANQRYAIYVSSPTNPGHFAPQSS